MIVIPVLDLLNGQVVHAQQGERHRYLPIDSQLTPSSEPDALVDAYFKLFPFPIVYIADLDAIQGSGDHFAWLTTLAERYPACEFWLDAGIEAITENTPILHQSNIVPVIGSETAMDESKLAALFESNTDAILSLDFKAGELMANHYLLQSCRIWPRRIIVMMLSQVGTTLGIDRSILDHVQRLADGQQIFVAGGIAGMQELVELKQDGIAGALMATALHNGVIGHAEIAGILRG